MNKYLLILSISTAGFFGSSASHVVEAPGSDKPPLWPYSTRYAPPPLLEGVGSSHLRISTSSETAQRYFNQGLSLLHCFWDFEATRAFKEALRHDDSCAMCYWGIYMALRFEGDNAGDERKAALERAEKLKDNLSAQERLYIEAASKLQAEDRKAYILTLEKLIDRYPQDVEAKLLLANYLTSGYNEHGEPRDGLLYAKAILRNLLGTHPNHHGVHHYWIHAVEHGPRPEEATASADKLSALAPNSGHVTHMPGHIYFRTGDYQKAHQAFMHSMKVDVAYMDDSGVHPADNWNYSHNIDFLVASCAEDGRYKEGLEWSRKLEQIKLEREKQRKDDGTYPHSFSEHYRMAPVEFNIRYGFWQKAREESERLVRQSRLSPQGRAYLAGMRLYSAGMEALEQDRIEAAERSSNALEALLWREYSKSEESEPLGERDRALVALASSELRAFLQAALGEHDQSLETLKDAIEKGRQRFVGDPPAFPRPLHESLGALYLQTGEWERARQAFHSSLEIRPNNGHALFGIARSYAKEEKPAEARAAFRKFLDAWARADADLPQVSEARRWLGN